MFLKSTGKDHMPKKPSHVQGVSLSHESEIGLILSFWLLCMALSITYTGKLIETFLTNYHYPFKFDPSAELIYTFPASFRLRLYQHNVSHLSAWPRKVFQIIFIS
jgi:hypothetical protein